MMEFSVVEDTSDSLLGTTATSTSPRSHTLTIPPGPARSISVTLSAHAVFVGPWPVDGTGADGEPLTLSLTIPSTGSTTIYTDETFAGGSTVTLSRPGQTSAAGSYYVGLGPRIGLSHKALELTYSGGPGVVMLDKQPAAAWAAAEGLYSVVGPSDEGRHGAIAFEPATMSILGVSEVAVVFAGDET